jgi:hypothetical protein
MTKVGTKQIQTLHGPLQRSTTAGLVLSYILHRGFTLRVLRGHLHAAEEVDLGGIEWGRAL